MKKIYIFFVILQITFCFGQQSGSFVLDWKQKNEYWIGETKRNFPHFQSENYCLDSSSNSIFFGIKLPLLDFADEKTLQISSVQYESISEDDLGELSKDLIPTKLYFEIKNNIARDKIISFLKISPIIKDGNSFKKVISFAYNFNTKSNNINFRTASQITNSVLEFGDWHRFYIEKSGVYSISKTFLTQLGINTANVNPRKIRVFGNGGRMLPLSNSVPYPDDLTENAIQVLGEEDGVFNVGDQVLFYGEGVDNYNEESTTSNNLYTNRSYYYINISGVDGKRIQEATQPSQPASQIITEYDDFKYHEIDRVNLAKVGRTWFGEQFDVNNTQEFSFSMPNIVTPSSIALEIHLATTSSGNSSFKIDTNGQLLVNESFVSVLAGKLPDESTIYRTIPSSNTVAVKLTFNNNGVPTGNGFLDYINLSFKQYLKGTGLQYRFQNNNTQNTSIKEYQISNANGIAQVWDITDIYTVSKFTNPNQSVFAFKSGFNELRKYIAIDFANIFTPLNEGAKKLSNQNLKGQIFKNAQGDFQDVDYLIITPDEFYYEAEKLANFHRNYSLLNVKVVTLSSIYPEFSSGQQDIAAIRNFIKYVYENASTADKKVKYINLFGDASYDFKNRISKFSNYVPIYHAKYSYSIGEGAFATDDFYGLMSPNEGNVDNGTGEIDIAVGRMIANSKQQATELVNKVIDYHDIKSYGNWRNDFVIVADDSDVSSDADLQKKLDEMANKIVLEKPFLNPKKILLDSYTQETSAGGKRYPQARKDVFNAFENGTLVINYLGHGGEDGLAQERIWEKSDGQRASNQFKYPLFITITCDFSRFDNPFRATAGEFTYWNPKGGAIAMITTVREIGQLTGEAFNIPLAKFIFDYGTASQVSIGEALRLAKNEYTGEVRIVACLGDPALMLAMPKPKVKLTKVNDVPVSETIDTFKALSLMKINGEVTDENDVFLESYNGEVSIQIYDKEIIRTTLNNDFNAPPINFKILGETIFRGNATVVNGKFQFEFVVPRDINIPVGNGKMSFYAKRNNILLDKTGVDTSIKIGGVNLNAPADTMAPTVNLFMNDKTFITGGITNESPIFLAFLQDENGINTAGGIGHDISIILDGNDENPINLNDYYETELDNFKAGNVKFQLRNLSIGLHSIKFKAFDVYNNPITSEIQFLVVGNESVTLSNVLNYPNPFVNYTQFWFSHNKPFEPLDVQIQVMTVTGKIVWTKNQVITTDGFLSKDISWDGKDAFGDRIGKGVYVYKLTVKSTISNSKSEKFEKLVIL